MDLCEFKAILVYIESSRTDRVTQKYPVLGEKKEVSRVRGKSQNLEGILKKKTDLEHNISKLYHFCV